MVMMGVLSLNARHLSPEQALSRAVDDNPQVSLSVSRGGDYKLGHTVMTPGSDADAAIYVFNRPFEAGYVVVSADDSTEALLGYSTSGNVDGSEMPPALKSWLEEYARQVEWATMNATNAGAFARSEVPVPTTRMPIDPMLTTRWNQGNPYNNSCPTDKDTHVYTGCVATSMSQVMNYHEWPVSGTGKNSYTAKALGRIISCDFSKYTFDWSNMADVYTSAATEEQKSAVADLMFAAAVSVDMDFSVNGSGASPYMEPGALVNHFGYSPACNYQSRDWYGIREWEDLIYKSLKEDGPVILGGNSSPDNGHSFVCDGYNADGYFHINWGWGGMSNGYFKLSALDPGSQGIGGSSGAYNYYQCATVGIRKPQDGDKTVYILESYEGVFTDYPGTVARIKYTGKLYNMSIVGLNKVYLGLRIDGKYYPSSVSVPYFNSMRGETRQLYISIENLPDGTYNAYPVFKSNETGNDWSDLKMPFSSGGYLIVSKNGKNVTVNYPEDKSALSVEGFSIDSELVPGMNFNATATFKNTGSGEFFNSVHLLARNSELPDTVISDTQIDVLPGDSLTVAFGGSLESDFPLGDYKFYLATLSNDGGYSIISDAIEAKVTTSDAPKLRATSIDIVKATPDRIEFDATFTNTGGFFYNKVGILVFPENGGYSITGFYSPAIMIPANSDGTKVNMSFSFAEAEVGTTYKLALSNIGGGYISSGKNFTVEEPTGIAEIASDAEVISTEIYNISGVRMAVDADTLESLPEGLYIIVTTDINSKRTVRKVAKR